MGEQESRSYRLPGQRERPSGWTPPPTTPGRSWAELVETIQGGLAVLDDKCRLAFVSDRFLNLLGQPDDLVGRDLRGLLPALADNDPRQLRKQVDGGTRIDFEQQIPTADGDRCWYRVTVVPCTGLGDGLVAVVFAKDITETSRTLAQLREATVGLTEVESELHRRVGRDVHDGPIQLLAALIFRLGMSDTVEADELQQIVSEVASTLRHVIEDFSPALPQTQSKLLEQWIAPFLIDSEMGVNVVDRRTSDSGPAELQAAFVLVYQFVRAVQNHKTKRTLDVELTNEHGGQRIVASLPTVGSADLEGRRAAQQLALEHHARALGGTLSVSLDGTGVRTASMWIPKLAGPAEPPKAAPAGSDHVPPAHLPNDATLLPQLRDSTWREIVSQAPERVVEFDDQVRVSFSNAAQQISIGASPVQLLGVSIESMFSEESLPHLAGVFDRLDVGEVGETDWHRRNLLGESRLVRLTASPRLDETGRWIGALVITDDRTDIDLLDELHQTALADLTLARQRAIEASIQRLEQPLTECELLIGRIEEVERFAVQPAATSNITAELASALRKIASSTSMLGASRLSINDLDTALRRSLRALLVGRRLVVVDNTASPPPAEISDVVFRITREAINNAVLHGKASVVTVTLANADGGISCEIHDDGVGIDPGRLHHRPGHLGTRAMQERARERGGTCRIGPDSRGGTLVSVWLPNHADRFSLLHGSSAAP